MKNELNQIKERLVDKIEELKRVILPVLEQEDIDLVELNLVRAGNKVILRLLVDKSPAGITLDECARLNQIVGDLLEREGIIKEGYILEVSSPGLDRVLKTKNDFLRCLNKRAHFFLSECVEGKMELEGIIQNVTESAAEVNTETKVIEIPFVKINKAKQIIGSN